jgi:protein-S-isoprenylcysteine O-methyltransferase Ste14
MASRPTRRRNAASRRPKNTAPAWKKFAIVLSAPLAVVAAISLLGASTWSFLPFGALVVAVAAAAVWLMARLLGVRLGMRSWD